MIEKTTTSLRDIVSELVDQLVKGEPGDRLVAKLIDGTLQPIVPANLMFGDDYLLMRDSTNLIVIPFAAIVTIVLSQ